MNLTVSVYNLKQLNTFVKYANSVIVNTKNASLVYEDLELDLALSICEAHKVLPIIALNKMLHPADLASIEAIIVKYKDDNVRFLVTDIGACNIAIKHGCEAKIIFDPQTMITNTMDLSVYNEFGFDALSMSLEIPFSNVMDSLNQTNASLIYTVFGHRMMFYSKRSLISLYEQKAEIKTSHKDLLLRESTRNDYFPVIENDNGTMIYRSYIISLLKFKSDLEKFKYIVLDPLYIDDVKFEEALKIYNSVFNGMDLEEGILKLNNLGLDIEDGFTYKDSVYQKEEF